MTETPTILDIKTENVWNIFELEREWPITNKGWERFNRRYVYRVHRRDGLLSVKSDPWNRSFIPWTSDVTVTTLDWMRDHTGSKEVAVKDRSKRYYRYVTVDGKAVKLQVIIL